ncbi:adenylyl-sulfate kinase, partial [Ameyamaea chiangmaiensis]
TGSTLSPWDRAQARGHRGAVFWLTGLSGSGKSTLARGAETALFAEGIDVAVLDGDTLRAGLCADLGFSDADRRENIRRAASVARIMAETGQVVIVALISPLAADRAMAREIVGEGFEDVFVDTSLDQCEARDPKGLYAAARAGRITGFTGIDAPYEPPANPDLRLATGAEATGETIARLVRHITGAVV